VRLMHLTKYAAVAGALAVPAAFAAPASATSGGSGSAFGIGADGLVSLPHTPAVSSAMPPGDKSLAELPPNPLIDLKLLHVTAHPGHARASVLDLKVARAELTAHLVTAECKNGKGSSRLVDASLSGHRLAVGAAPNSSLKVPVQGLGDVSVILNKQVRGADGGLTVTAIQISLPLVMGKTQTISISSASCRGDGSVHAPGSPSSPTPTPTSPTPPGEAPAPTPVPSDLPVTG
jgi:hypothetical protein